MTTEAGSISRAKRKSPARPSPIILAALEERLLMIEQGASGDVGDHAARMRELFDELRRSHAVGKKDDSE